MAEKSSRALVGHASGPRRFDHLQPGLRDQTVTCQRRVDTVGRPVLGARRFAEIAKHHIERHQNRAKLAGQPTHDG